MPPAFADLSLLRNEMDVIFSRCCFGVFESAIFMSGYSILKAIYRGMGSPADKLIFSGETWVSRGFLRAKGWLENRATHDEIYDRQYYAKYFDEVAESAVPMAALIVEREAPRTCIDVGCGSGEVLLEMSKLGVSCVGFDNSSAALEICRERGLEVHQLDLTAGTKPTKSADLVISTEVAEHLPPEIADAYVAYLVASGDVIYMTAATPGQGGTMHLNEQPYEYWIEKFQAAGVTYDQAGTESAREIWAANGVEPSRAWNLLIFRKG